MTLPFLRGGLTAIAALALAGPAMARQNTAQSLIADCATEPSLELENTCLRNAVADLAERLSPQQQKALAEAPEAPDVQGLGAEQVMARQGQRRASRDRNEEDNRAEAVVVDLSQTSGGEYIFVLDNDQVWAQQDFDMNSDLRLREGQNYRVEIVKGFLSGYRMRFLDESRLLKVERLR